MPPYRPNSHDPLIFPYLLTSLSTPRLFSPCGFVPDSSAAYTLPLNNLDSALTYQSQDFFSCDCGLHSIGFFRIDPDSGLPCSNESPGHSTLALQAHFS